MPSPNPIVNPVAKKLPDTPSVEVWVTNKIVNKVIEHKMKSWIPKLTGIAGLLTLWGNTLVMLTDGNPATNPDWSVVLAATMTAIGVISARQNNVTSEEVGAK